MSTHISTYTQKLSQDWKDGNAKQKAFMVAGALAFVLTIAGLFVPLIPQVPFAIAAAALFAHGSPRVHQWIRKHPRLGPPVKDWEDHRVVRPKLKAISTVAMIITAAVAHWKISEIKTTIAIDVALAAAIVFVLTRKSKP